MIKIKTKLKNTIAVIVQFVIIVHYVRANVSLENLSFFFHYS